MLNERRSGKTLLWTSLVWLIVGAVVGTLLITTVTGQSIQGSIAGAAVGATAFLIISLLSARAKR
jgi:hypothetical protein